MDVKRFLESWGFAETSTGGGLAYSTTLPNDTILMLTNGDADLVTDLNSIYMVLLDQQTEDELDNYTKTRVDFEHVKKIMVNAFADYIIYHLDEKDKKKARCFGEMHDYCDPNMFYPEFPFAKEDDEQYIENHIDLCNLAVDVVNEKFFNWSVLDNLIFYATNTIEVKKPEFNQELEMEIHNVAKRYVPKDEFTINKIWEQDGEALERVYRNTDSSLPKRTGAIEIYLEIALGDMFQEKLG